MSQQWGTIYLDGLQLDLDPDDYIPISGVRRGSIHKLIDGTSEFQDRGFDISDLRIEFSGIIVNQSTYNSLYASFVKIGHSMAFTDFKGNVLTVAFEPGTKSFDTKLIKGSNRAYTYTIKLVILSITSWYGGAYPPTS